MKKINRANIQETNFIDEMLIEAGITPNSLNNLKKELLYKTLCEMRLLFVGKEDGAMSEYSNEINKNGMDAYIKEFGKIPPSQTFDIDFQLALTDDGRDFQKRISDFLKTWEETRSRLAKFLPARGDYVNYKKVKIKVPKDIPYDSRINLN